VLPLVLGLVGVVLTLAFAGVAAIAGNGRRLIGLACAPKSVCVTGDAAGRVFSATG
jgi:hypothetical protein